MIDVSKLDDITKRKFGFQCECVWQSQLSEALYITYIFDGIKIQLRIANHSYDPRRKGWFEGTKLLEATSIRTSIKILLIAKEAIENRKNPNRWTPPKQLVKINYRWVLREEKEFFAFRDGKKNYKFYRNKYKEDAM